MGRIDSVREIRVETYIETSRSSGYDVLINGYNKYLNFNSISGSLGYGFRDNNGVMEYKNLDGDWLGLGSGGGGGIQSIVPGTGIDVDNTDPLNPIVSIDNTVVTETSTDTLTNKTIDDYTNFIHADGIHLRVKATEPLVKGDVIKFVGFNNGEQAIEVAKRNDINVPAIGVIYTASMATGDFGMAVSNGLFKQINTSAFSVGTILYPNASGGFTATNPGGYAQQLAYVVRSHAVNGEIMINVGPVYEGIGDMQKSVYDTQNKQQDIYQYARRIALIF